MSQSLEKAEADRCARWLRDAFPSVPEQMSYSLNSLKGGI